MRRDSGCACCLQLRKDDMQIYSVTLEEDQPVRNLKPAVVKVYDYYQTSKNRNSCRCFFGVAVVLF